MSQKIGIALGSGSSRGWAHIGVLKALAELEIHPQVVCGTSIGALVGATYVSKKLDALEIWGRELTRLDLARYFELNFSLNGFINTTRFEAFMAQFILPNTDIESLDLPFASVATKLMSGEEVIFDQGDLTEAVWASISLPGVFPPFAVNGQWMVDGGLVNPVPVSVCRALGATQVIAVNLNEGIVGKHLKKEPEHRSSLADSDTATKWPLLANLMKEPLKKWDEWNNRNPAPGLMDTVANAINIMQTQITRERLHKDKPDYLIAPDLSHFGLMEFHRASEAITLGYETTMSKKSEILAMIANEETKK